MQALRNVSSALRCLLRLLTTSVPAKHVSIHRDTTRESGRTRLDERRLEHIREERQHRVQRRKVLVGRLRRDVTVLDTRKELRQDRQVKDERRSKERVLHGQP